VTAFGRASIKSIWVPHSSFVFLNSIPSISDHELLRRIGSGSYGEVWLARNVVGTWRAVKVVRRATFERAAHFEREFKGMQKFEPLSRSHEGFVDILQISRNDEAGYFYYVMELADAAESVSGPNTPPSALPDSLTDSLTYSPKTLRAEQQRLGRLPVSDCVNIGATLGSALAHLHEHGLVHRDVKPSNIIFVGGVPKLADIGLVADASEARSFVGTVGFIPPEGPGSPQADFYSLGKVLYEISTGQDRQDFPASPPELLRGSAGVSPAESGVPPDSSSSDSSKGAGDQTNEVFGGTPKMATGTVAPPSLIELNEVMLKACHKDVRQRYATADAMLADLQLLQRGDFIKRKHQVERRWQMTWKAAAAVVCLTGLAFGAQRIWTASKTSSVTEGQRWYLEGRALFNANEDSVRKAALCFSNSIVADSHFAPAFVGLSECYRWRGDYTNARQAALRALALDDRLADAHAELATIKRTLGWDWLGAEREYQRAVELKPTRFYAYLFYSGLLVAMGKTQEAVAMSEEGLRVEPRSEHALNEQGAIFYHAREYDRMIKAANAALRINRNFERAHLHLWLAYMGKGMHKEAVEALQRFDTLQGHMPVEEIAAQRRSFDEQGIAGFLRKRLDWTLTLKEPDALLVAESYARLNEPEPALHWLEKAVEARSPNVLFLRVNPRFDNVRSDPRFVAIVKRVGLPP
jgi:serine/threonine protein kinase/Tfp pilus assembly protein PilF